MTRPHPGALTPDELDEIARQWRDDDCRSYWDDVRAGLFDDWD